MSGVARSAETRHDREAILRRAYVELQEARTRVAALEHAAGEPIAVVGMSCRLPGGVMDPQALWSLLSGARDAISEVPADRWDVDAFYDPDPDAPGKTYSRHGGFIDDPLGFDARFFDIPPREAGWMDPQHRLVLELGWAALEDAGVAPDSLRGSRTGVFVGMTGGDYLQIATRRCDPTSIDPYIGTGNAANFASGRLSYLLGLVGPSMAVDTACSSSLVSVHLACQSLRAGESELALAGGVNLLLAPETTVALAKSRMLSPSGRCRTFDARADGYVRGEGGGFVVLKRLSDVCDGDGVLAVIRGSAVNQDGRSSGLTVPYAAAQQQVIARALEQARVEPEAVGYVEAHGTGTPLGDPIELGALARVLGRGRTTRQPLWIGSLKTNIGHLEAAAGIAGLMKAILVAGRREIPPHLHFEQPNPRVAWDELPLRVVTQPTPLPADRGIVGVSSFGISGTNAHVVVDGPPAPATSRRPVPSRGGAGSGAVLVKVSAHGDDALASTAERLAAYAEAHPDVPLDALAFASNVGRANLSERGAVVAADRAELVAGLRAIGGDATPSRGVGRGSVGGGGRPRVAFLVAGQGSRYGGSARELYAHEPAAARMLDTLAEVLGPLDELPLAALLEPGDDAHAALARTEVAQPALYALALTLGAWWQAAGVTPDAVLGHSVGAYAAAALAGALDPLDGARLVAERGRLMGALPAGGAMAAVRSGPAALRGVLDEQHGAVAIAALNAREQTVLSGEASVLDRVLAELEARAIHSRRLAVSHAFHSPLVEPALAAFERELERTPFRSPERMLVSDTTAEALDGDLAEPGYWLRHAREPVDFVGALRTLHARGCSRFVELGPANTLLSFARATLDAGTHDGLPSLAAGLPAGRRLRRSLGGLWAAGAPVDWRGLHDAPPAPPRLPTYPFQHRRHDLPGGPQSPAVPAAPAPGELVARRIASPLAQHQFEAQVDGRPPSLVAEHVIHGRLVVPGVVYLELLLDAAEQAGIEQPTIEDLVLSSPLIAGGDGARDVHVTLEPLDADGATTATIHSRDPTASEPRWQAHALAAIRPAAAPAPGPPADLDAIRARCADELDGERFYGDVWHPRFELGPRFRLVEEVHRGDGEAIAALRMPAVGATADVRAELLLLDACVQVLMAALPADARPAAQRPLSVGIGHRRFARHAAQLPARVWCHAVVRSGEHGATSGDLFVYDESGAPLVEIEGVRFAQLTSESVDRLAGPRTAAPRAAAPATAISDVQARLRDAGDHDRAAVLVDHLRAELGAVLGLEPEEVRLDVPLTTIADSLMIAELKGRIETTVGVEIPVEALFEQPTVGELASWLAAELGDATAAGPTAAPAPDAERLAALLADLDELSDEDALARLAAEEPAGSPERSRG